MGGGKYYRTNRTGQAGQQDEHVLLMIVVNIVYKLNVQASVPQNSIVHQMFSVENLFHGSLTTQHLSLIV